MTASEWDWTLRVFDHVQLNASDYRASVRFYETVLSPLGIPKIAEHEQGTWFGLDGLHEPQRLGEATADDQSPSLLLREE
jgi:catechol 2,3-dioxygenase-like lactoylglutathione lyase family enzyme